MPSVFMPFINCSNGVLGLGLGMIISSLVTTEILVI
jgi:C4-dicarboxylate-specific signal transduction histidine kinase